MDAKYRITLDGVEWTNRERADFLFETIEDAFEKAKFFLNQGYCVYISNIIDGE